MDGEPSERIRLRRLVAATDFSSEGRAAVVTACRIAAATGAKVTALSVEAPPPRAQEREDVARRIGATLQADLVALPGAAYAEPAVAFGFPGIEISRYAEDSNADLLVLGRKNRSSLQRLLSGDTVDDVARRSRLPCLIVRDAKPLMAGRVLVALDGSERGLSVLFAAVDFTRAIAGRLRVITVEPHSTREPRPDASLYGKTERLVGMVDRVRSKATMGSGSWEPASGGSGGALAVHRGPVIDEVLGDATAWGAGVLVLGYHRGGPPGVVDAGSVARRLAHDASCAVLTIPL